MVCDGTWQAAGMNRSRSVVRVVLVYASSLTGALARGTPDSHLPSSDILEVLSFHQFAFGASAGLDATHADVPCCRCR